MEDLQGFMPLLPTACLDYGQAHYPLMLSPAEVGSKHTIPIHTSPHFSSTGAIHVLQNQAPMAAEDCTVLPCHGFIHSPNNTCPNVGHTGKYEGKKMEKDIPCTLPQYQDDVITVVPQFPFYDRLHHGRVSLKEEEMLYTKVDSVMHKGLVKPKVGEKVNSRPRNSKEELCPEFRRATVLSFNHAIVVENKTILENHAQILGKKVPLPPAPKSSGINQRKELEDKLSDKRTRDHSSLTQVVCKISKAVAYSYK